MLYANLHLSRYVFYSGLHAAIAKLALLLVRFPLSSQITWILLTFCQNCAKIMINYLAHTQNAPR